MNKARVARFKEITKILKKDLENHIYCGVRKEVSASLEDAPKALPISDLVQTKFPHPLRLTPRFRVFLGNVHQIFNMYIYGSPGSGKSTLALKLAQELSRIGHVLYITSEESFEMFQVRSKKLHIRSASILIAQASSVEECKTLISQHDTARFIIIDSITNLERERGQKARCWDIQQLYPERSFIFLGHLSKDERTIQNPAIYEQLSYIVVKCENLVAMTTKNRFGERRRFKII